jgi:hypothetical protein
MIEAQTTRAHPLAQSKTLRSVPLMAGHGSLEVSTVESGARRQSQLLYPPGRMCLMAK